MILFTCTGVNLIHIPTRVFGAGNIRMCSVQCTVPMQLYYSRIVHMIHSPVAFTTRRFSFVFLLYTVPLDGGTSIRCHR